MPQKGNPARRIVAILERADMTWLGEVSRGISAFASAKAVWQLTFAQPTDGLLISLQNRKPDGLILGPIQREHGMDAAAAVAGRCVGVVGWPRSANDGFATFDSDDQRVGELAARHFLQKGFREFAFVGDGATWSSARATGLERELRKAGHRSAQFQLPGAIAQLTTLSRPLAIFTCDDRCARAIAQICRTQRIDIPQEVAILGVGNDELECELCDPSLSSIAIPWRRIGYDAASTLDRIIDGQTPESSTFLVPPSGVIERQSTDTIALSDPHVAAALRFIREHAHARTTVADVVRKVPIGRRSLEKRFRAILKRTPLEEIRRVRIERAKQLLATTNLSIPEVAGRSGFGRSTWFSEAFHELVGSSPIEYRRRYHRSMLDGAPADIVAASQPLKTIES
jgi:LacI family transcriptional regulator